MNIMPLGFVGYCWSIFQRRLISLSLILVSDSSSWKQNWRLLFKIVRVKLDGKILLSLLLLFHTQVWNSNFGIIFEFLICHFYFFGDQILFDVCIVVETRTFRFRLWMLRGVNLCVVYSRIHFEIWCVCLLAEQFLIFSLRSWRSMRFENVIHGRRGYNVFINFFLLREFITLYVFAQIC